MSARVQLPPYPQPGMPVDADWGRRVVDYLRANTPQPGRGMRFRRSLNGTFFDAEALASRQKASVTALEAWAVRWRSHDTDGTHPERGERQVLAPLGCATVTQGGEIHPYVITNGKGKDADGKEDFQWYKIPDPTKDEYADIVDIDDGRYIAKMWTVYALLKPWPRMKVDTDPESFDEIEWSFPIARIGEVTVSGEDEGSATTYHVVQQIHRGSVEKTWGIADPFAIRYTMEDMEPDTSPQVQVINAFIMAGRQMIRIPECEADGGGKDITGWESVWVRINHPGEEYGMELVESLSGTEARSDDDKTVFKIYELKDGHDVVTSDTRSSARDDFGFYTNKPDDGGDDQQQG